MKKVLVTGASGAIGINVIKYLLSEGKYEITALDLRNKSVYKRLKKYQKRIKIIYGDVNDYSLMEDVVKQNDYIIHLASVLPPLGDFSKNIGEVVDYKGCENIIKAINYYNKNCHLFYASTTSLYDKSLMASVKETIKEDSLTNFSYNKYITEELIKKKLKNYTIFRVPLVLSDLKKEPFIYNVKKDLVVEVTTTFDAAYAFVKALNYTSILNKKIFNIGMGPEGRYKYQDILDNILKNYGLSLKYVLARLILDKDYISPVLIDSDDLNNLINYRTDSIEKYYKRLYSRGKNRPIGKLLGKIILYIKKG